MICHNRKHIKYSNRSTLYIEIGAYMQNINVMQFRYLLAIQNVSNKFKHDQHSFP